MSTSFPPNCPSPLTITFLVVSADNTIKAAFESSYVLKPVILTGGNSILKTIDGYVDSTEYFILRVTWNKMGKRSRKEKKMNGIKDHRSFQSNLLEKLQSSRFRNLNEKLFYTKESNHSAKEIAKNSSLYQQYHEGFRLQSKKWSQDPAQVILSFIKSTEIPKPCCIADFGCGDAAIAADLETDNSFTVHSFDLFKTNKHVTVANCIKIPLKNEVVDIGVFSLALMGKDYVKMLKEANRVLCLNGKLIIAEIKSRFVVTDQDIEVEKKMHHGIDLFKKVMKTLGFKCITTDESNKMFILLQFVKISNCKLTQSTLMNLTNTFQFKEYKYKKR